MREIRVSIIWDLMWCICIIFDMTHHSFPTLCAEFAEIADQIAQGNLKELQRQVILNFRNLGRSELCSLLACDPVILAEPAYVYHCRVKGPL